MIIFDFDQTLVDTQPVEALRTARKWREVMAQAPRLIVYDGIHELLTTLHRQGQTLAILTKSPDMVPRAFIAQHKWPIEIVVGFHQVTNPKPDPEGLLRAMAQASARPEETFHIGDKSEDTRASRAANVMAIGSGWGVADITDLRASKPDYLFTSVTELQSFLVKRP